MPFAEAAKCYLCAVTGSFETLVAVNIGDFDPDNIFFCPSCFKVAPWDELEDECGCQMFIPARRLQSPRSLPLLAFPNRFKYTPGADIVDVLNGKPAVQASITKARPQ